MEFISVSNGSIWPFCDYCQQQFQRDFTSAVDAKAVVNSEKSKIMPPTAAYEQIAEVRVAALHEAGDDPKRT